MTLDSIWTLQPTIENRRNAADFASKTLPWTFNRMSYNTSKNGQNNRALNIVKGILAQEMLKSRMLKKGVNVITDNSYRSSDIFDFLIESEEGNIRLDLKTINHYSNYNIPARPQFSLEYLVNNQNYSGADWRRFFPMLMPHNQIGQDKDAYCFGISSSIDFRKTIEEDRDDYFICAFPYGSFCGFISNKKLCGIREEQKKGIFIDLEYESESLYKAPIKINIIGDWDKKYKIEEVELKPNKLVKTVGPFSMLSSFNISKKDYDNFDGNINISVSRNDLKEEVLNSQKMDINEIPEGYLTYSKSDFCNLILPINYTLNVLGWIYKEKFLSDCRKYPSWVWPKDSINKFENQEWSQLTESDVKSITKLNFQDCIEKKPTKFNAGWLKTNGRGGGACCYVFPNIGRNGGVMETNLYVLPSDLNDLNLLFNLLYG